MKKYLFILLLPVFAISSCKKEDPSGIEIAIENILTEDIKTTTNPHEIAPLSALVEINADEKVSVSLEIKGESPVSYTIEEFLEVHELEIAGLYPLENEVEIRLEKENGNYALTTIHITTDSIPEYLPEIQVNVADKAGMEPGFNFCCLGLGDGTNFRPYPMWFDSEGIIRGYIDLYSKGMHWVSPFEPLENGNLLFGTENVIYEYDFHGLEVNRWELNDYYHLHHDIIEKPDGNFIGAVRDDRLNTADDQIVEVDRNTAEIVKTWDMREILDMDRYDLVENDYDWFHMNAIWYSESDNSLLVSGRNQCVVKVSYDNELIWILAPHKGWGRAGVNGDGLETSDYLLTAVDSDGNPYGDSIQMGYYEPDDFGWNWGQHAPMYLENGNLFLFDNGFNRNFTGEIQYSCGIEYDIEEENKTVKQVWQYGKERGPEFFSAIISDVDVLSDTKNRYITSGINFANGGYSTIAEVSYPGKELIFDANLYYKNSLNPSGEMTWGGFDLTYRAERIKIGN